MNELIKYSFIVFLLFSGSCKKIELPPENTEEVIFNISADTNFGSLNIEAGYESFVLFPDFFEDDKNVLNFVSTFQKDDCQVNCKEKLTFRIRDFQQNTGTNLDINQSLSPNFYQFEVPLEDTIAWDSIVPVLKLDLDATNSFTGNSNNNLYIWSFENGISQTFDNNPIFTDVDYSDFSPIQSFNIRLNLLTDGGNGCQSSQKQNLQFQNANQECKVFIEIGTDTMGIPTLTAVPTGKSPFLFFWNTGDTSQTIPINQNFDSHEVTFIDANGCKSTASVIPSGNSQCSADFSASFRMANDTFEVKDIVENLFEFSKIIIEYTNENGEFYSTEQGEQDGQNVFFEILSIEEGEMSQTGKPTKKLTVRFECQLFNDSNESIKFSNGEGVIGMAYPE